MTKLLSHFLLTILIAQGLATAADAIRPEGQAAQDASLIFNPGSIASTGQAVTAATPLKPGDILQVEWGRQWWAAKVVSLGSEQQVKIHYVGWADLHDELVPRSRLQLDPMAEAKLRRPQPESETNPSGERIYQPGAIESTGKPVTAETPLKEGDILQVQWNKQWWAAKVLALEADDKVRIHYVGWQDKFDELVPRSRLQLDPQADAKARATRTGK